MAAKKAIPKEYHSAMVTVFSVPDYLLKAAPKGSQEHGGKGRSWHAEYIPAIIQTHRPGIIRRTEGA